MEKSKLYFEPVDTRVEFPKLEEKILKNWYESGTVGKYLRKNNTSKRYFSFVDGPITANNPMGIHHGWSRTFKDIWQRYKNMQGYKQRFQNGFDCQGLWVEVEVEKDLGFKTKKDIEDYGIEKFVEKCKERVEKYAAIQTEQSKRLGYFMDWENSYYTMGDDNNYMIWHFLKVCHENGWIYKGAESVPWCPRCQTAISQHEILTEDYKEVTHDSIYFALPLVERKGESMLVWTTTPWTLPANIAAAVDENLNYSLVEVQGKKYWLAKDTVETVFKGDKYKVLSTKKGSDLVGLHYAWAFDDLPAVNGVSKEGDGLFHSVIATDKRIMPISTEEGTGIVHTAVSAGTEDFRLGKKLGLPMIPVIADDAKYLGGLGEFTGKNAKEDPNVILDYLKAQDKKTKSNWVYKVEKYKHRYPRCWRCKEELVWKVTDEWYISMDVPSKDSKTLRQRMIEVAKKINWIPEFGLKRELDWLNNMHDWLISKKNRYWGLALPIWECESCGEFDVIGSKEELKEKAVKGWDKFSGKSPHKPQIDEIEMKCTKCGGLAKRIEPVGNPWLDAGIVSFSTIKIDNKGEPLYLKDRRQWSKWFPADFITESFPGQFKNWFYSMIAMSTVLEDREPYKTVLGFATLLAEDGRPMHKSWGNAIEFNEGAKKIGVDVIRWMYAKQNVSDNLLFGYKTADEVRRRFHLKLWNAYNYFVTYANLDGFKPSENSDNATPGSKNVLDKWIISRFSQAIDKVEKHLDEYNANSSCAVIEEFVDDLSNWYIRRSRGRTHVTAKSDKDKQSFYETTHFVLLNLVKILAPFIPFISEMIYDNLTKKESVHLADWPVIKAKPDMKLIKEMKKYREFVEKVHAQRKKQELPVRRPLISVSTTYPEPTAHIETIIKDELNVKKIVWTRTRNRKIEVELDDTMTEELVMETKARELIRKVQNERKKLGAGLREMVIVTNPWLPKDIDILKHLKKLTLAKSTKTGKFKVELVS